jgi:extradiol dioxygenase family protein
VLHLSLPIDDLDAARQFYLEWLGCPAGRVRPGWMDVWFYGMQLALHQHPDQTHALDEAGVRHFGVTLAIDELERLVADLEGTSSS